MHAVTRKHVFNIYWKKCLPSTVSKSGKNETIRIDMLPKRPEEIKLKRHFVFCNQIINHCALNKRLSNVI